MVVNINKNQEYDIYIGRPSIWGNPYSVKEFGREKAIELYRSHLWSQIKKENITLEQLAELYGKRLGCFCAPKPCHGFVLEKAAEWAYNKLNN